MHSMLSKEYSDLPSSGKSPVVPFNKMQALGNDFVVVAHDDLERCLPVTQENLSKLARSLCDRHFGIGADGLIVVSRSTGECQLTWKYINSDGSGSDMCGNGLRCLALWSVNRGLAGPGSFSVLTGKGPVHVEFKDENTITTCLGRPYLEPDDIPVRALSSPVVNHSLSIGDKNVLVTCIGMGNPHCVIFDAPVEQKDYQSFAEQIQSHPFFPQGVNVEFVECLSGDQASVLVWERGCGATLACASGAAAVLVAGVLLNKLARSSTITLPGGDLHVFWSEADSQVRITGPARVSFVGSADISAFVGEVRP